MLASLPQPFLATLFGSTTDADCIIRFTLSRDGRQTKRQCREDGSSPPEQTVHNDAVQIKKGYQSSHSGKVTPPRYSGAGQHACEGHDPGSKHQSAAKPENGSGENSKDAQGVTCLCADDDADGVVFLGEPILAHRVVLRCSSGFFRAYLERWEPLVTQHEEPEHNKSKGKRDTVTCAAARCCCCCCCYTPLRAAAKGDMLSAPATATPDTDPQNNYGDCGVDGNTGKVDGGDRRRKRGRPRGDAGSSNGIGAGLPEIVIPLDNAEEVLAATHALRLIYGCLEPHTLGFKEILMTRRMAGYLLIEGGVESCDYAMVAKLDGEGSTDTATVLDAYSCWQHFPEDSSFNKVLLTLHRRLIGHFHDALSVLNTVADRPGSLLYQFLCLPPPAIEALLASDDFGTDSESSVLLLLARWLQANPIRPMGLRTRLCRLIRVLHLTPAYLTHVLPQLDWFAATPAQRAALTALAAGGSSVDNSVLESSIKATGLDLGATDQARSDNDNDNDTGSGNGSGNRGLQVSTCKWLVPARRQCITRGLGRIYGWSVNAMELKRMARSAASEPLVVRHGYRHCMATFTPKPASRTRGFAAATATPCQDDPKLPIIIAHGLRWKLVLAVSRTEDPYMQLSCRVPLLDENIAGSHRMYERPMTLTLWKSGRQSSTAPAGIPSGRETVVFRGGGIAAFGVGYRIEFESASRRRRRAAAANTAGLEPDLMDAWEPYLYPDGDIRGELVIELPPLSSQLPPLPPPPQQLPLPLHQREPLDSDDDAGLDQEEQDDDDDDEEGMEEGAIVNDSEDEDEGFHPGGGPRLVGQAPAAGVNRQLLLNARRLMQMQAVQHQADLIRRQMRELRRQLR